MRDQQWDQFLTYVNAYYAVQEAYDAARRNGKSPAQGLKEFCRDANPFLWDERGSAEPAVYEGFRQAFSERFSTRECTAAEARAFVRTWLTSLEGGAYGTSLVSSWEDISDEQAWEDAYEPIARQVAARAVRLERTPQDEPLPPNDEPPTTASGALPSPSAAQVEAVIQLLAHGDEQFAASLRARLEDEGL